MERIKNSVLTKHKINTSKDYVFLVFLGIGNLSALRKRRFSCDIDFDSFLKLFQKIAEFFCFFHLYHKSILKIQFSYDTLN